MLIPRLNDLNLIIPAITNLNRVSINQLRIYSQFPPSSTPLKANLEPKPPTKPQFNATISLEDLRVSPFNLSTQRQLRLAQIKNLQGFIPGDPFPPTKQPIGSLKLRVRRKVENLVNLDRRAHARQVLWRKFRTPHYQDYHGKVIGTSYNL